MIEHNINVKAGSTVRLPTSGKYCDRDIVVSSEADFLSAIIDGSITEVECDATIVRKYIFLGCSNLISAILPNATSIGDQAFATCSNLSSVNLPNATDIGNSAFQSCGQLTSVTLPNATKIGTSAFYYCPKLEIIDLPKATSIGTSAFYSCSALRFLVLRSTSLCTLAYTNVFDGNTPIKNGAGFILVPSSLVDSYKKATNWSSFSNKFKAIEDYTVDGTITGELDPNKI